MPHLGLADQGLAGADSTSGLRDSDIQPGRRLLPSTHRRLVQKGGFDPKLVCCSFFWAFQVQGRDWGSVDGGICQGTLRHMVHFGRFRQPFFLHLLQLLLGEAVAKQRGDYLLGVGLEAFTARGLILGGQRHTPPVGQRDARVPGAPPGPVTCIREAPTLLAQLTDVLLIRVLPEAGGVDGVVTGGSGVLRWAAQLPPQSDEHGGNNDEQGEG